MIPVAVIVEAQTAAIHASTHSLSSKKSPVPINLRTQKLMGKDTAEKMKNWVVINDRVKKESIFNMDEMYLNNLWLVILSLLIDAELRDRFLRAKQSAFRDMSIL